MILNSIDRRLKELYGILAQPHTLDQLASKTGRARKAVYKDIGKLAMQGCRVGSRLGVFWIEQGVSTPVCNKKFWGHSKGSVTRIQDADAD